MINTKEQEQKNLKAFLTMIAFSEGTLSLGDNGYNVLFGGKLFNSYKDHPRVKTYETHDEFIKDGKKQFTSAAGRYQITMTNFDHYKKVLDLKDFSPEAQDKIAIELIKEQGALLDILEGRFSLAIDKIKKIWASLPGAGYGQRENKLAKLREKYLSEGGVLV